MDNHLADLFRLVTEDVIQTGEPVGSQYLVDTYKLEISPATVRNWFAELENQGLLAQTHTSSGRIPTEKGYRYYVDKLMDLKQPRKKMVQDFMESTQKAETDNRRIKILAKSIAEQVTNAVVIQLNESDTYYTGLSYLFAQQEFHDWNRAVNMGEVLDRLDEVMSKLKERVFDEPNAFIGSQCPFGNACGAVLFNPNKDVLIGILGPMRLDYKKGFSLLLALKDCLNN